MQAPGAAPAAAASSSEVRSSGASDVLGRQRVRARLRDLPADLVHVIAAHLCVGDVARWYTAVAADAAHASLCAALEEACMRESMRCVSRSIALCSVPRWAPPTHVPLALWPARVRDACVQQWLMLQPSLLVNALRDPYMREDAGRLAKWFRGRMLAHWQVERDRSLDRGSRGVYQTQTRAFCSAAAAELLLPAHARAAGMRALVLALELQWARAPWPSADTALCGMRVVQAVPVADVLPAWSGGGWMPERSGATGAAPANADADADADAGRVTLALGVPVAVFAASLGASDVSVLPPQAGDDASSNTLATGAMVVVRVRLLADGVPFSTTLGGNPVAIRAARALRSARSPEQWRVLQAFVSLRAADIAQLASLAVEIEVSLLSAVRRTHAVHVCIAAPTLRLARGSPVLVGGADDVGRVSAVAAAASLYPARLPTDGPAFAADALL